MKKVFIIILVIAWIFACAIAILAQDEEPVEKDNTPKEAAEAPESVYMRYVEAIHKGDLGTIKKLVYTPSLVLWNRNSKEMLVMSKTAIPKNPTLLSKKPDKQAQYNYMILNYTGTNAKGIITMGEVRMIVEKGEWRVFQEVWKPKS